MRTVLFASLLLLTCVSVTAQQPKNAERIYRLTDKGIKPPQPISTPAPEAPADNRKIKSRYIAVIAGYVGTDGLFHSAKILQSTGDSALDAKALDGMQAWKFHPCTKNGEAVNCSMAVEVEFHLYQDPKKSSADQTPDQSLSSRLAKITP